MRHTFHISLDHSSQKRVALLVRELGWTPSELVRERLRVLEASYLRPRGRNIVALGGFRSGASDLESNEKLKRGFGRR
jgi:hypothetical protein